MSDEKRTVNMDGLSEKAIDAFQEAADALKGGRGMWLLDEETYDSRMHIARTAGSVIAFGCISIMSAIMAVVISNEDGIRTGLSKISRIFGKK